YVEASPPDSELVSSEVMEIVIPETKSSSTSLNSLLEETNNFDNSLPEFTTFSNVLFDAEYESDSSDDQSCYDEDVLKKIVSKPLSEEEIIPMKSLRTHDSSLPISSKIDSLLDEFANIRLIEKLLYDNSSPRPPEEFVSVNSDAKIKSFSPSPILVKDSDSLMEEIDLFCTLDYPMPPGIMDKDYDSERDILIGVELSRNSILTVKEYQEKDKIGSKPDKNRKRGKAGKSQKQLQWRGQEKLKKMQKEGQKMHTPSKYFKKVSSTRTRFAIY
nr:hypothetical protein [Tanacetum cinerariifolium]